MGTLLAPGGILLYLDEIQYFNKKQQQSLLEFMENGSLTLIASTTENPYFYVYSALLSRSTVFEFKAVAPEEVRPAVLRALEIDEGADRPAPDVGRRGSRPLIAHGLRRRRAEVHQRRGAALPGGNAQGRGTAAHPDRRGRQGGPAQRHAL